MSEPTTPEVDPFFRMLASAGEDRLEEMNALLDELREHDPVHPVAGLGLWLVTRHEDVRRLSNDPDNVTNDPRFYENHVPRGEPGSVARWAEENGLFAMPVEDHARLRRLAAVAFTPRAIRRMDDQVREVVEQFAAPLRERAPGEVVDLLGDFIDPIPNLVISRITGVPAAGDDEARFRRLAQQVIQGFFHFSPDDVKRAADEALAELAFWVRDLAKERRDAPREDFVTDLVRAQDRDERLSDDEIILLITRLIAAGSETTVLAGMTTVMSLLRHPEDMERIRADRNLIPGAVDEILRWGFGGPQGPPRYAVRDFELRGRQIRKGQMLMLSFAGANRDPRVWEEPSRFDIERDCRELTVFGSGPHYCLGANLARGELAAMIEALLDILPPGSRLRDDRREFRDMGVFRRPTNLPVEIGAG